MEVLLIIVGWFIVQVYGIQKGIAKSKDDFNILFFLKDTWLKILTALVLSFGIGAGFYLTIVPGVFLYQWGDISFNVINLIYLAIGSIPEFILQKIRKRFRILKTQ